MTGPSGSVRAVLLGLVLERPGHGYELANRLVDRLGETWQFACKDIYRVLADLEDEGLLSGREERRPRRKKTYLVYHPTASTAQVLSEWIETLSPKEPIREGIRAKVVAAREEDAPSLLPTVRATRWMRNFVMRSNGRVGLGVGSRRIWLDGVVDGSWRGR